MTIKKIKATNFKCFEQLDLDLASLTLLTGYNGAGKSSALQPMLLMAQALREPDGNQALPLNGKFTRLGTGGDVLNRNGGNSFAFEFSMPGSQAEWRFVHHRKNHGRSLQMSGSPSNEEPIVGFLRQITYLSALRMGDLETFPFPDSQSIAVGDVGAKGEFAPYWYITQADEEVPSKRLHPNEERLTVRGQIDAWFNELFHGASVNAEALGDVPAAKLSFRFGGKSGWRRPENVGFGLSYAFPLIVALTCSRKGQTLIVDSPEAHLHPSAQSKLGEMLAHFAASGVQIIVESHSDHLLSGVRLALKRRILPEKDLSVYFFGGNEDSSSSVEPTKIGVNADGTVENWPEGFFDQSLKDLVELS